MGVVVRPGDVTVVGSNLVLPQSPENAHGQSTYEREDPFPPGFNGNLFVLKAGTPIPYGLAELADGVNVGGTQPTGHHTTYDRRGMTFEKFSSRVNGAGWVFVKHVKEK